MKKIIIEIPDDLSPEKEAVIVAKKVANQMLKLNSGQAKQKLIGNQQFDSYKFGSDHIEIKRIPPTKGMNAVNNKCFCGTLFAKAHGTLYYSNYGGLSKKKYCCSNNCFEQVKEVAGDRVSTNKKEVKHQFLW